MPRVKFRVQQSSENKIKRGFARSLGPTMTVCHASPLAALAAFLMFAIAVIGAPSAGWAQIWTGPNDACASDALLGNWGGLRSRLAEVGIGFGLQNQTELWGNLTGGRRQGIEYDGLATASLCIDLDKAAQWKGATIFASGFQIYGPGPSVPLVGALQLISNIEATPSTKLYDLWFEQQLFDGKVAVRFGQEGSNDEMMLAGNAGLFLNSSFGYPAMLALDLPSGGPNYPLATPFVRVNFSPSNEISFVGAVYTEDPAPPGSGDPQLRDRHGTAFRLNDHALSLTELWYSPAFLVSRNLPGTYKLGIWYATGSFADPVRDTDGLSLANPASNGIPLQHSGDYAIYWIVNQMLWHKPNTEAQGIGVFLQIMRAPDDRNLSDLFVEGGVTWKGPLPGRSHDQAGLALTYAGIGAPARRFSQDVVFYSGLGTPYAQGEPIIEATYRFRLTPWFKVQPDVQYVVNPGAGIPTAQNTAPLRNALVLGVRFTANF
jgi:porin